MLFAEIEMSMMTMKIHGMVMAIDDDWNDYDYDDDDARSSWPLELIQSAAQLTSSSTLFTKSYVASSATAYGNTFTEYIGKQELSRRCSCFCKWAKKQFTENSL